MNRLVLIGNGYDIAAGLKTSYEDFLVAYFKGAIKKTIVNKESYQDQLIVVTKINKGGFDENYLEPLSKIAEIVRNKNIIFSNQHEFGSHDHEGELIKDENNYFDIKIKSEFLERILGNYNWRDIESFYFESLVEIYKGRVLKQKIIGEYSEESEIELSKKRSVLLLNIEFDSIKNLLAKYLEKISSTLNTRNSGYPFTIIDNISEPMDKKEFEDFFNKSGSESDVKAEIEKGLIVNFNYTNLLSNHMNWNVEKKRNFRTINIHGSTYNPKDIIFGYGDDTHPMYSELELIADDEYLRHLKSFHYPLSKYYLELMNFLEYEQFEVQVIGHSLGLSDRVLLKSIFEHDNCKCIRLIHQGRKDEKDRMPKKYMALARHFDNKMIMRNKIVPFNLRDSLH